MKYIGRVNIEDLRRDGVAKLPYAPFDVLVSWVNDAPHAIENACNHSGASLAEGRREGCRIRCPMHGYIFDLRTGELVAPKGLCADQRRFEARVEGNDVVVYDHASTPFAGE